MGEHEFLPFVPVLFFQVCKDFSVFFLGLHLSLVAEALVEERAVCVQVQPTEGRELLGKHSQELFLLLRCRAS